jgi:hypothetical protein
MFRPSVRTLAFPRTTSPLRALDADPIHRTAVLGTPERGGHFAVYEAPAEFIAEVRARLRALV